MNFEFKKDSKFKEFLSFKKVDEAAFDALGEDGQIKLVDEFNEGMRKKQFEMIESKASPEDLEKLENSLKELLKEHAAKYEHASFKQGEVLNQLMKKASNSSEKVVKSLVDEIKEKKEELKSLKTGIKGEVTLKALTNRASVTDNMQGVFIPDITQLGHKERSVYNILPKVPVSDSNTGGVIRYRDWDEATTVRAATMIAEGAAFPESTAKFRWYTQDLRKVGDTLSVTEEFFEDEAQAAAELDMFLMINVDLKIDDQLINGDNTGQNLNGIINSSVAYVPVASGIQAPNLKDLAIKVKNDITRTRGSKFKPDFTIVNSATMESLVLAKDANNNYIFDEQTGTLAGLNVVVDENIADNQMIVGDRRFARIYEKSGLVMSKDTTGTQFLEDEMTIKVRKRMLLLIKNGDQVGFRKVTSISAALTTLGS